MGKHRVRSSLLLALLLPAAVGCELSARYAQTASEPDGALPRDAEPRDTGLPRPGGSGAIPPPRDTGVVSGDAAPMPGTCPSDLAARVTQTSIDVDADIRYRTPTNDSFPSDERVGFGVTRDGRAFIAWLDVQSRVRVTPLDASLRRSEPDILVNGLGLGGFVVHDDGFALLTRRMDPGEPLTSANGTPNIGAAFMVRYRDRTEVFAVPLTGTAGITREAYPRARDCAPNYIYGRLAWNGVKYGANFQVHGCMGDPHQGSISDKLVYVNARGGFVPGGWDWNCEFNLGLRLVAEPNAFSAVCFSDRNPAPGLNLVTEDVPTRQLAAEYTESGYIGAAFGSLVKVPADGSYAIGWLSRGLSTDGGRASPAKAALDIALLRLGADYAPIGNKRWLTQTNDVAEVNLHVTAYGRDRLLVVWDAIERPRCEPATCFGPYSGTIARIVDLDGNPLGADARLTAPPNSGDDLATFPNGDVGWAYVPDEARSYETRLMEDRNGRIPLPSKRRLAVARMRLCE